VVPRLPPVTLRLPPVELRLPPVELRLAPVPLLSLGSHQTSQLRFRYVVLST
jgi:hypothetical protein